MCWLCLGSSIFSNNFSLSASIEADSITTGKKSHANWASANAEIAVIAALPQVVTDYRAVMWPDSWFSSQIKSGTLGTAKAITYSFETARTVRGTEPTQYAQSVTAFTDAEKSIVREALVGADKASGVYFIEVGAGLGSLTLFKTDFSSAGVNGLQNALGYYDTFSSIHEVYFNTGNATKPGLQGTIVNINLAMHEIGHALGLKHGNQGEFILPSNPTGPALSTRMGGGSAPASG